MAGSLNIGVSALISFQRAITTVGNNISNIDTRGYSRQEAILSSLEPEKIGNSYFGRGVEVGEVRRINDDFVESSLRKNIATYSENKTLFEYAAQVDQLLGDKSSGLSDAFEGFFNALHDLNSEPSNVSARQNFLSVASTLVDRFNGIYGQLDNVKATVDNQMEDVSLKMNSLATSIADINNQIISSGEQTPALLDLMDAKLAELSEYVDVTTIEQQDGALNVFIGSGQPLVLGASAASLTTLTGLSDPDSLDVAFASSTSTTRITNSLTGGQVTGLLNFNEDILNTTKSALGRIAIGLAVEFNSQHQAGITLNNQMGGLFFGNLNTSTLSEARAIGAQTNTGTAAVISVAIASVPSLETSDYRLLISAGATNYTLTRLSDNTSVSSGLLTALPITVDGFTLSKSSGTYAAGDEYLIVPTRNGASDMTLNILDPRDIALACPVTTRNSTSNGGTGIITPGVVVNSSNAAFATNGQLTPPILITFSVTGAGTTYSIYNNTNPAAPVLLQAAIPFTPGSSNAVFPSPAPTSLDYGYRVSISGVPVNGDSFNINYNSNGAGDNRNGLLLTDLQTSNELDSSTLSFSDAYGSLVASTGASTGNASLKMEAGEALVRQSQDRRDSIAAVNLDEEAAKLLKYQQAYQATARYINIAGQLFDSLIASMS